MNKQQQAAAGEMADLAAAATLVDQLTRADNKGDMLGAVLAYRRQVRAELLESWPRSPASWDGVGLPEVGADVLFDTGSSGEQVGTVTGYEVRPANGHSSDTYRVDIYLVYKGTSTPNCRGLHQLRPVAAAKPAEEVPDTSGAAPRGLTDAALEAATGEPHVDGWPLYSGLPPAVRAERTASSSSNQDNGSMDEERFNPLYPGHPMCIAVQVMRTYPSLEAADGREDPSNYPNALRNSEIRGAGGNVYAALNLLKHAVAGHDELALAAADRYWQCSAEPFGVELCEAGVREATALRAEFDERVGRWRAA